MKLPKRFTLSTLLLLMTLAAVVFGYAQIRKRHIVGEIAALEKEGGISVIKLSDDWFWPTPTQRALLLFKRAPDGTLLANHKPISLDGAKRRYAALSARLKAIGVEDITASEMVTRTTNGGLYVETRQIKLE